MAEYHNHTIPSQNYVSVPSEKSDGRQYKSRFFCLLCELQIQDETMVEDVRIRAGSKYSPGPECYYPFLEEISKRALSSVVGDYVTLCSYCSSVLRAQWITYEQQSGKIIPPEKRTYQPHIFTCGVCGVHTYRRRVRALATDEFPFLFSKRKPDSICLTQHTAPHNKVHVVVCLDCFETLHTQKADYDRMGVPLLRRDYSWISRTNSQSHINMQENIAGQSYQGHPINPSRASKSLRSQRVSVSGFPGQPFYPSKSQIPIPSGVSSYPSRRSSVSQMPCNSRQHFSEMVIPSPHPTLQESSSSLVAPKIAYPTSSTLYPCLDAGCNFQTNPYPTPLYESLLPSNSLSKIPVLVPPSFDVDMSPSNIRSRKYGASNFQHGPNSFGDLLLPQQFEQNNNSRGPYSPFYFHQLYLQLKNETCPQASNNLGTTGLVGNILSEPTHFKKSKVCATPSLGQQYGGNQLQSPKSSSNQGHFQNPGDNSKPELPNYYYSI